MTLARRTRSASVGDAEHVVDAVMPTDTPAAEGDGELGSRLSLVENELTEQTHCTQSSNDVQSFKRRAEACVEFSGLWEERHRLVDSNEEPIAYWESVYESSPVRTCTGVRYFAIGLGVCVVTSSAQSPAAPDGIGKDAERIHRAWSLAAQRVHRMRPLFLAAGQEHPVPIPMASGQYECTSVGFVGAWSTDFSVAFEQKQLGSSKTDKGPEREEQTSVAGSVMLVRCGAQQVDLRNLVVRMRSPQAALEIVVAQGATSAVALDMLLPERNAGPLTPQERPTPAPIVASYAARLASARREIDASQGTILSTRELQADLRGSATEQVRILAGCHRVIVIAEQRPGIPVDVDLEVSSIPTQSELGRDKSFANDATVGFCVGEPDLIELGLGGAMPSGRVSILHARWPIARGIPTYWSATAQAATQQGIWNRASPQPQTPPLWQAIGPSGITQGTVPLSENGCYLMTVAPSRGDSRFVRLMVRVGDRTHEDAAGAGSGVAVGFCAKGTTRAFWRVVAPGRQLQWNSALWRVATMEPGGTR